MELILEKTFKFKNKFSKNFFIKFAQTLEGMLEKSGEWSSLRILWENFQEISGKFCGNFGKISKNF